MALRGHVFLLHLLFALDSQHVIVNKQFDVLQVNAGTFGGYLDRLVCLDDIDPGRCGPLRPGENSFALIGVKERPTAASPRQPAGPP
jgi:hypothetical protein